MVYFCLSVNYRYVDQRVALTPAVSRNYTSVALNALENREDQGYVSFLESCGSSLGTFVGQIGFQ